MSAESQNTLPQTPTYTEYMQSLKPQNKPSTNTPTEDIKFEPEVIKLSECFYKHNTRSINLPWHKNYKILNDLSQNDSGGNSGNLSNGHLSNGHSHSHQLTNQINLRQNLSLLSLSHNSSSSQNPNPMKQNLVSTTDISNSDWSTVKWHNFQNNIVAFKEIPDNLLAYVIVSRSKTNIKVMKADESTCKTVIKGFQRDIIEVKWNDCYYNSKHLRVFWGDYFFGRLGILACGHPGIWVFGHPDIRASGRSGIWASGHLGIRASSVCDSIVRKKYLNKPRQTFLYQHNLILFPRYSQVNNPFFSKQKKQILENDSNKIREFRHVQIYPRRDFAIIL